VSGDGKRVRVSKESGHVVEHSNEMNYMFRLSEFKEKLRGYLSENVITPKKYTEALFNQIDTLTDLSVSREAKRISWSIPVPGDPDQVVYVWLDALVNYLTVAGYPHDTQKLAQCWPADVHVVGKDILRFHAIYWPAFLMAAGLPLPKRILCHGHWLVSGRKMSKSVGNVVDPVDCMEKYTRDGLRYFLLREGVPGSDCSVNMALVTKYVNSELANTLGNLYQRMMPFNKKLAYPRYGEVRSDLSESDKQFLARLDAVRGECDEHYEAFNFYNGIQTVMGVLRMANNIVQDMKPWDLVKSGEAKDAQLLQKVLFLVYESLRISGILLQPIVPDVSAKLLDKLNVERGERLAYNARVDYGVEAGATEKRLSNDTSIIFKRL
jgi:methionyl-tRNA synthetase